jgi:hypothetical protein
MSTLAKQVVSVLFGATDQDTSKKAVKLGDLVTAENCQQVKGGEYTKRDGFTATEQGYENRQSIDPEAFCVPDGTVKLVRDATDDVAYAQGPAGGEWESRGGSPRLIVKDRLRFNSTDSTKQISPMAKQAGNWFVWLDDESHFRCAEQDPDGSRLAYISDPIAVEGPTAGSGTSTHVKSFAVINDPTFDASNLWVYWIDWTWNESAQQNRDAVWALRIPLARTTPEQIKVAPGIADNRHILTAITATVVDGVCYLAQCGIYTGEDDAVEFRSSGALQMDGWSQHFTVNNTGVLTGTIHGYLRSSTSRAWCASGICWLSSTDYRYVADHLYYAFWTQHTSDRTKCVLVLVDVTVSTGGTDAHDIKTADLTTDAVPAVFTAGHCFVGQVTGREYDGGVAMAACVRASNEKTESNAYTDINTTVKADRIWTGMYTRTTGGGDVTQWTARGAWLAHGILRMAGSTSDYIVTGWHDADEVQICYHLRDFWTGDIICQFLYGQAAFSGGCGASYTQLVEHVSDIQQPNLAGDIYAALLPAASVNVNGSCDISAIEVSRPSNYQSPAPVRGLALAPGGIPTIAGGWQDVQEAGPLVYPSLVQSFYGEGSS